MQDTFFGLHFHDGVLQKQGTLQVNLQQIIAAHWDFEETLDHEPPPQMTPVVHCTGGTIYFLDGTILDVEMPAAAPIYMALNRQLLDYHTLGPDEPVHVSHHNAGDAEENSGDVLTDSRLIMVWGRSEPTEDEDEQTFNGRERY